MYFRDQEHLENEPEHLVRRVMDRLDEAGVQYSSVEPKNLHYKKHGLAHIEIDMNPPRPKSKRVTTDTDLDEDGLPIEFTEEEFMAIMAEEEKEEIRGNVHPRDKTKVMKVMKETKGVLSVESMAGISFPRGLPPDEMERHNKATSRTFFKQRLERAKLAKHKAHEESMHRYREPAKYRGRDPKPNDEL